MLSVIVPAYNEELNIKNTAETITGILEQDGIPFELLFVDDGSNDRTWEYIEALAEADERICGIRFSRNFGKEGAIYAGLWKAGGDCCVVIDCDLQHPPEKIVEMYRLWEQGYEIVEGYKSQRGAESLSYKLGAKFFYSIISRASGIDMTHASDFKLLDRKAALALLNMKERDAFFRGLSSWIGFRTTQVEYTVQERKAGRTKWSGRSLRKYAISNITAFTTLPMQIVTLFGIAVLIAGIAFSVEALYRWVSGDAMEGFTTVIILLCYIGSLTMISLGIIGHYISKIYEQIKDRPRFIISETRNLS